MSSRLYKYLNLAPKKALKNPWKLAILSFIIVITLQELVFHNETPWLKLGWAGCIKVTMSPASSLVVLKVWFHTILQVNWEQWPFSVVKVFEFVIVKVWEPWRDPTWKSLTGSPTINFMYKPQVFLQNFCSNLWCVFLTISDQNLIVRTIMSDVGGQEYKYKRYVLKSMTNLGLSWKHHSVSVYVSFCKVDKRMRNVDFKEDAGCTNLLIWLVHSDYGKDIYIILYIYIL